MTRPTLAACAVLLLTLATAACDRGSSETPAVAAAPAAAPSQDAAAVAPAAAAPAPAGAATVAPPADSVAAAAPAAKRDFDPADVPESTASLPPFPFFKAPDGLASVLADQDRNVGFDREHMIAGDKVVAVEGKVFRDLYPLNDADHRQYTEVEFQRNYANAVAALGGVEVSRVQYTPDVEDAFGGRDAVEKHYHGVCAGVDCENHTYLIRQGGKEYWIQVSTGAIPLHGEVVVLERQGMTQSLGFLSASEMKKAIDATGHVALHINFDTDKASLRADAQPLIAEIGKLLQADPTLRLSIEGHTDNTGTPAHNLELSGARARSVLGALVGLGVDPGRLQSKGFGQDKPVADNGSDAGRAQNRRVELVKLP